MSGRDVCLLIYLARIAGRSITLQYFITLIFNQLFRISERVTAVQPRVSETSYIHKRGKKIRTIRIKAAGYTLLKCVNVQAR